MRYLPLLLGTWMSGLGVAPLLAQAADPFWAEAQRLVQQQQFVIGGIEQTIASPDPEPLRLVQGQVRLHLSAVDRFLKARGAVPEIICGPGGFDAGGSFPIAPEPTPIQIDGSAFSLTPDQASVYCGLFAAALQLQALSPQLEQRQRQLAAGLPSGSAVAEFAPPETAMLDAAAEVNVLPAPIVGRPAKQPIADALPPPPAIAAPDSLRTSLQIVRQFSARAIAAFPEETEFVDPAAIEQTRIRDAFGLSVQDLAAHSRFLAQPGTGAARVLPAELYNSLRLPSNRAEPTLADQLPFAPLVAGRADGFVPRFAVQVADGAFAVAPAPLDYGFIQDIGTVALEDLPAGSGVVESPLIPHLFTRYRPPQQLAAIQLDRRQLETGKLETLSIDQPIQSRAAVVMGHTYLMRLIQFELPEVVTRQRPITRRERRQLAQLLAAPSSDLLIAFRPVAERPDGTYTVLWRILAAYPDPTIADLDRYVRY